MEVRLTPGGATIPEAPPAEGLPLRRASGVEPGAAVPSESAENSPDPLLELDREGLKSLLKRTADLVESLTPSNRHLKYEVIDEAGMVQIQVIETLDGNIVRKIPADEIVKLVSRIRETLNERLDVVV